MMKEPPKYSVFLGISLLLSICISACERQQSVSRTPSQTVTRVYDATNRLDTTTYLKLVTKERRGYYAANPSVLPSDLAYWSSAKTNVTVLSESIDQNIAVVKYHLVRTGKDPEDTTLTVQLMLEDGEWKYAR